MKDQIKIRLSGENGARLSAEQLLDQEQAAPRNVAGNAVPPPRDEISSRQGTRGGAADLSRYLAMLSRGRKNNPS
ncbi:MAG: hypothetical protein GX572_01400 [Clostridia bacterium]|nr:hypothetical protein [Clostridia bacterium]